MTNDALRQALEAARAANARGESLVLLQRAGKALALAEAAGETTAAADAGLLLARGLFSRGNYVECVRQGRIAHARWRGVGHARQACAALRVVAHGLYEGGALASALATAQEGFGFAELHGLVDEAIQLLVLVGTLHGDLQAWHDGESLLLQALSRSRERPNIAYEALATSALVVLLGRALQAHQREGRAEQAAAVAAHLERRALSLYRLEQNDANRSQRAFFLGNAGEALGLCGRMGFASEALAESLALAREEGLAVLELSVLGRQGRLQVAQQDLEGAARSIEATQRALQTTPHAQALEDLLALQAQVHRQHGREDEAAALEAQVAQARQAREQQTDALRRELDLANDASRMLARLKQLESGA